MASKREQNARKLAWIFLLLLSVHEVHAVRESIERAEADAAISAGLAESTKVAENIALAREGDEFTIRTWYALGSDDRLYWKEATLTIQKEEEDQPKHISIAGLDSGYRLLPDSVVAMKTIKGMNTVKIVGYQSQSKSGEWGNSVYDKDKALFIRTEMNPTKGVTEASTRHWRYAGHTIFKPADKAPYYIDSAGWQYVIADSDAKAALGSVPEFSLEIGGEDRKRVLTTPDREIMLLLDTMLGQMSCLNHPSKCAFRCFYDAEKDECGPAHFCKRTSSSDVVGSALAPFGAQQKCKAVGSEESHEAADQALVDDGIESLKTAALDLATELDDSPEVSRSTASRASVSHTVKMWEAAAGILQVLEALPFRLQGDNGDFPIALERMGEKDMKTWKRTPFTRDEYESAQTASVDDLRHSKAYSVAAKLHSELVKFLLKRPTILMESVKLNTGEMCLLKDNTEEDQEDLKVFVEYYLGVPGANKGDLKSHTTRLASKPKCEEFLLNRPGIDTDTLEEADQGEQTLAGSGKQTEVLLERVSTHLKDVQLPAPGSAHNSVTSFLQTADAASTAAVFFFIACVIVCIICSVLAGFCFTASLHADDADDFFGMVFMGAIVLFGAFAMATPVGWIALVISVLMAGTLKGLSGFVQVAQVSQEEGELSKRSRRLPLASLAHKQGAVGLRGWSFGLHVGA